MDGGEVVIPTVLKGRVVSDEEAIAHYEKTGANFGTFGNPDEAKAFSEWLHNKHEQEMRGPAQQTRGALFAPRGIPGDRETSGYRTPQRNKAVGGVANSFHTRRGPDGRPLASDRVPPQGMSMGQYANLLRRQNPDLDVINEGDHVHLEPKGR